MPERGRAWLGSVMRAVGAVKALAVRALAGGNTVAVAALAG
ncbi:hypothetical protein [Pararhodobacter oceanensis]